MRLIYTNLNFVQLFSSALKFSLFAFLLTLPISNLFSQCDDNFVQIGSYHIEFVGVEYDYPEEGQSTWYYTVFATSGKDISHVTFPLNKHCIDVVDSGVWGETMDDLFSGMGKPNVGKDPKAKIWGMKFDEGVDSGEEQNYYFTLDQNLAVEAVAEVAIKAGRPFYKGIVCGPSPECNEPQLVEEVLESCISGQIFEDSNFNGIREPGELPIENISVTLLSEFGTIGEIITQEDGMYSFCGLQIGEYIVSVRVVSPYRPTIPNVGSDQYDSDLENPVGTRILAISFDGESIEYVDAGLVNMTLYDQQTLSDNLSNNYSQSKAKKNAKLGDSNIFGLNLLNPSNVAPINVFPNPAIDVVNFRVKENASDVMVEIRSQSNQLISRTTIQENAEETSLDISQIPNGNYLVYFISKTGVEVKKLVKMR